MYFLTKYDKLFLVINMKKYLMIIGGVAALLALVLIIVLSNNDINDKFIDLSFNELQAKIENGDTFPLYIGSARCAICVEFQPTLKGVIRNNDFTMYHIDLDTFSMEESAELSNMFNITGTPTILFIVDGDEPSVINRIVGKVSEEDLVASLKEQGYIK